MGDLNKTGRTHIGDVLTPREREVLGLLAAGNSAADIARQLGVSAGTVRTHLRAVYKQIGAENRIHATRYYLEHYGSSPRETGSRGPSDES